MLGKFRWWCALLFSDEQERQYCGAARNQPIGCAAISRKNERGSGPIAGKAKQPTPWGKGRSRRSVLQGIVTLAGCSILPGMAPETVAAQAAAKSAGFATMEVVVGRLCSPYRLSTHLKLPRSIVLRQFRQQRIRSTKWGQLWCAEASSSNGG